MRGSWSLLKTYIIFEEIPETRFPKGKENKYFYARITKLLVVIFLESFIKYLSKNHPIHSLPA